MNHLLKYLTVLFLLFSFSSVNLLAVSTSCPGETISNLDGTSSTATQSDSGTITGNTTYYYKFTPASDGTIQVDSYVSGYANSLHIQSSCSTTIWNDTDNSNSKSSPEIAVNAGQEVIIALERRYSTSQSFSIDFTYTVTPPPSCSPLRDSANLTTANTFYTNSSHYNDSNWNVGPGSNGGTLSRAYYFTVDGPGDVDIRLYDVDNNQAKFSVALGSCPSNLQDLTSSHLNFTSAGDFYVYIYYESGSNTNIEHKLDVTFSPPAPPTMGDVPDTIGTIDTVFTLDISNYVTATNNDAILEYNLTGTLPDGLSFDSSTGLISGTPTTETNASSFSVTATDKDGVSNSDDFTLAIQEFNIISDGGRNFALRKQENLFGDVIVIGNTVLCQQNSDGECTESGNNVANNDVNLQKAPESSSILVLPTDAIVEYARLYWLGRTDSGWNSTTQAAAGNIQIQKDGGGYIPLTANIKDAIKYSGDIWLYSASADASSIVTGGGTYSINTSNFYTVTGKTSDGLGTSGSWALVVIYSDPNETTAKNVTIFDGFKGVTKDNDAQASVTGFLTPNSGVVDSTLYTMAAEGDKYLSDTSDQIQMGGATYNTSLQNLGTFNSRIDLPAERAPKLDNNNGTDIHIYNVGTSDGGKGIIDNNEVGANFNFTSDQDVYYPSLFVFSTELYLPQMCYDYSLKQDGRYLPIDRATYPEAQINGIISSSDIEVGIYLRNEESDLDAQGIAIRTDLNTTQFNQTGEIYTSNVNGTTLISRGTPSYSGTLCDYNKDGDNSIYNNGCTDGHNIRKGNGTLGEYEYVFTQFTIQPQNVNGLVDINESLGMSIKYYIVADGQKIEYPDYVLGGINVPICPPTGGYTPQWGQFNVVRSNQPIDNITNNLYTQVSRKPFDAAVVFDATPDTGDNQVPSSEVNTTVLVEMIDLDAYGDINASCANPDASISDMIYVPVTFNSTNGQVNIPTQTSDYYNFAVKNATFRIWYFENKDKILIEDWGVTTTDSTNRVITSIHNLYDSNTHTLCSNECSTDDTSIECFACIKTNYAQPLCARDNFSVRPESYSLNLYDINQSLPNYDIETDPNNLKNLTKVNLSIPTKYAPAVPETPTDPISLAAGYEYRFDINASGHNGIAPTPGYTRVFNEDPNYNAILYWTPLTTMTGCNDDLNRSISFYFKNGVVINEERYHDNAGIYRLNLTDTTWTAVDYANMTHHTAADSFEMTPDCNTSGSGTQTTFNGCTITSEHGFDDVGNLYKDHRFIFHPYKFNVDGIISSVGMNHENLVNDPYIYMADTSNAIDENMSYHLNGTITAVGFNNNPLNNFVTDCMAVGLDLNLSKSDTTLQDIDGNTIVYQSKFHNLDENDSDIIAHYRETNETVPTDPIRVQTLSSFFIKDLNGTINTINNFNYHRTVDTPANPIRILLNNYDVNCTNPITDCTIFADLRNDKTVNGRVVIDQNLTHYYGRTNAPRQRFTYPTGTYSDPAQNLIYYEVYCDLNNGCNKSLLQNGNDANSTNDPRWFINTNHTVGFGTAGNITQKGGNRVTATDASGNHQDSTNLVYDGSKGYPYKTTMENNASSWLIFNRYNPAATRNEFEVEFERLGGSWAGVHETDTTTGNSSSSKTNRRTMW